jgi:type I restriction enzyme R subunit
VSHSPDFALSEAGGVQLQALTTLVNLGWRYVPRAEAERQRGGRRGAVVLEDIARDALGRINRFEQDGTCHPFTASGIEEGLRRLRDLRFDGLLKTNEIANDMLLLGVAVPQTVGGLSRERPFRFVAWADEWEQNSFHMTAEFAVQGRVAEVRPDVVLFVNGIPFASLELKRTGEKTAQAISQTIRNQKTDDGAPQLFVTQQVLIAGAPNEPRYGTVGTPAKYWSVWKEPAPPHGLVEDQVAAAVNGMPAEADWRAMLADFEGYAERHSRLCEARSRWITEMDRTIVGLAAPQRLLDMARRFTLFDKGVKKIARWQQVSAVLRLLDHVEKREAGGARRQGGVVWHTQGSGKSLTMVMLARALNWQVENPRVILVTDRRDLDRQIRNTFKACQREPKQARTGAHLMELIQARTPLITTLVNKFRAGVARKPTTDDDPNIFVLVDESHRSQYGDDDSLHADMRRVLPNACYIGFTGTPLFKKAARNTFLKFGPLVDKYSIRDAVADGAVVPLIYEGRAVDEDLSDAALDAWFDRESQGLTAAQQAELKRRMSSAKALQGVSARLKAIAWDVRAHFLENFAGHGLKGQLVAPSKAAAVRMLEVLEELNDADPTGARVTAKVVISGPDAREGHEETDRESRDLVQRFWNSVVEARGGEDRYFEEVIGDFDSPDAPDLLIVVSKLLTGFDVQRNAVLYVAKSLKDHGLLQAIARVNRVYDDEAAPPKNFGLVVDYCGTLKNLTDSLVEYEALAGYDAADISGALVSIREEAAKLPELHAALLSLFNGVSNRWDREAYARALADEILRDQFQRALSAFASALGLALASRQFVETERHDRIRRWKDDLKRFEELRAEVRLRYGDALDWAGYEARVQKLLDTHVTAAGVSQVIAPVDILDEAGLAAELGRDDGRSAASLADEIASKLERTATERMEEDPAFNKRFSEMVRATIEAWRQRRIDEQEYLRRIEELRREGTERWTGTGSAGDEGAGVASFDPDLAAIEGVVGEEMARLAPESTGAKLAVAAKLLDIVRSKLRVGWQDDGNVQNEMRSAFEDWFLDVAPAELGLSLGLDVVDPIADRVLAVARRRLAR